MRLAAKFAGICLKTRARGSGGGRWEIRARSAPLFFYSLSNTTSVDKAHESLPAVPPAGASAPVFALLAFLIFLPATELLQFVVPQRRRCSFLAAVSWMAFNKDLGEVERRICAGP